MNERLTAAAPPAWQALAELLADVLGRPGLGPDDDFFAAGGDSVTALTAVARARRSGLPLGLEALYNARTPRRITATRPRPTAPPLTQPVPRTGPLLAAQDRAVRHVQGLGRWPVLPFVLESAADLDPEAVTAAVRAVVAHHDALRIRLRRRGTGSTVGDWSQWVAPVEEHALVEDLRAEAAGGGDARAGQAGAATADELQGLAERLHGRIDPVHGPVLRAALVGRRQLLFVLHHLVADPHSLGVIRDDLETAYRQIRSGSQIVDLPPATGSVLDFAARCVEHATGPGGEAEARFWGAEAERLRTGGVARTRGRVARHERMAVMVGPEVADGLGRGRELFAAVAGALAYALRDTARAGLLCLAYTHHGRGPRHAGLDLSRTVGWPMAEVPVLVDTAPDWTVRDALVAVRAELARPPGGGLGFLTLRGWAEGVPGRAVRHVYDSVRAVLNVNLDPAEEPDRTLRFASGQPSLNSGQPGYSCGLSVACNSAPDGGLVLHWAHDPASTTREAVATAARTHADALRTLAAAPAEVPA